MNAWGLFYFSLSQALFFKFHNQSHLNQERVRLKTVIYLLNRVLPKEDYENLCQQLRAIDSKYKNKFNKNNYDKILQRLGF